jgi:two-component system chemotaxis response regulator CheY
MHVLIVDDETTSRTMLCQAVQLMGFTRDCIDNPLAALPLLEKADLVLMDWELPGMTGIDFIKAARANDFKAPIIMVTVKDEYEDIHEAMKAGANDLIWKPFSIKQIMYRVEEIIKGRPNLLS